MDVQAAETGVCSAIRESYEGTIMRYPFHVGTKGQHNHPRRGRNQRNPYNQTAVSHSRTHIRTRQPYQHLNTHKGLDPSGNGNALTHTPGSFPLTSAPRYTPGSHVIQLLFRNRSGMDRGPHARSISREWGAQRNKRTKNTPRKWPRLNEIGEARGERRAEDALFSLLEARRTHQRTIDL